MRNSLSLVLSTVVMMLISCTSHTNRSQTTAAIPPPPAHAAANATMSGCPMMTSADPTSVIAVETPQGAAISFTTAGDVTALRARIHQMAERHEHMRAMHATGDTERETMPDDDMYNSMMAHPQMRSAQVAVEDIPGGARLVFTATSSANLTALRDQVRQHAAMMARGRCPLMGGHPSQMRPPNV